MTVSKRDWAHHWALQGLYVFPVKSNTKEPAIKDWPDLATLDPAQIDAWWEKWPDANIGAHPGASGHVVIDVDMKKVDGMAGLEAAERELDALPETFRCTTASGGAHLWFKTPEEFGNTAGRLAPGVDTRSTRGFVVMPRFDDRRSVL